MFGMDVSKASLINQRCAALLKALQEKLKRASAGYRDACPERERERGKARHAREEKSVHVGGEACTGREQKGKTCLVKARHGESCARECINTFSLE